MLRSLNGLRRLLESVPLWSPVDKGFVPLLLLFPIQFQILMWQLFTLVNPDCARYVDISIVRHDVSIILLESLGAILLVVLGFRLRTVNAQTSLFQHLAVQYYALTLSYFGYEVGSQSYVYGVMMVSAPLVGLILMDRLAVYLGLLSGLMVLVACSLASAAHRLPYAPVVASNGGTTANLFWLISDFYFVWPHLLVAIVGTDRLLVAWRQREAEVRLLSLTDPLTGISNRRHVVERLDAEVARARRQDTPLTVVMIDLDNFKKINDRWGHAVGDRVLQDAAVLLQRTIRQQDALGRYGGEEFLLLLADTPIEGAVRLVERCREQLQTILVRVDDQGLPVRVSGSFGVACTTEVADFTSDLLLNLADAALYRAKAHGRNRVELALPTDSAQIDWIDASSGDS